MRTTKGLVLTLGVLAMLATSAGANLVLNGGLNENWDGWTAEPYSGKTITTAVVPGWNDGTLYSPKEGTNCGRMNVTPNLPLYGVSRMIQKINLQVGKSYDFSAWVGAGSPSTSYGIIKASALVVTYGADDSGIRIAITGDTDRGGWKQITGSFTAEAGEAYAKIRLEHMHTNDYSWPSPTYSAYFDDIVMTPEPTTLGLLLAGGGLALLRKRT